MVVYTTARGAMERKICFIGHRDVFENIEKRLKAEIENQISMGGNCFMVGIHGDFDKIVLTCLRELKRKYTKIKIEVVITSLKHAEKQLICEDELEKEYYDPYQDVDRVMYEIENEHFKRQIIVSNQKMIDDCNVLICYVDNKRNRSGAKRALSYAQKRNLQIINLKK